MRKIIFLLICVLSLAVLKAQDRFVASCGNEFESQFNLSAELLNSNRTASTNGTVYKIPVVVHVLTDEPAGVSNISDCIIQNQIDILNNCFRKKAGAPNTDPSSVDAEIEFYLARKDPNGLSTNGIVRKNTTNCNYNSVSSFTADGIQKQSRWPVNKYLNIWVLKTMPNGNTVRGQAWAGSTLYGVFVHYSFLGSKNSGCPNLGYLDITGFKAYDLGMTVVHEVGHYLGLLHTFDNCSPGDGCDDTPAVSGQPNAYQNAECRSENDTKGVCTSIGETRKRMWQNYLDYTDDPCMNRFTACQVGKMRSLLTTVNNYINIVSNDNFLATGGNLVTSIDEFNLSKAGSLKIFPNPFINRVNIEVKDLVKSEPFRVVNVFGQEVKRGVINSKNYTLELNNLPQGMYYLQYQKQSYKLIRQ